MDRIWATKAMEVKQDEEPRGEVTKSEAKAAAAAAAAATKRPSKRDKEQTSPKMKKRRSTSSSADPKESADAVFKSILSPTDSNASLQNSEAAAAIAAAAAGDAAAAPQQPHDDPPDSEELIKALQELEVSASSDAVVREKIAKLPSSVSEVSQLETLQSPEEGKILMEKVRQKM